MLVQDYLHKAAEKKPDKVALIYGDNQVAYSQLLAAAQAIAAWLIEQDVAPGFRGGILSDDPFEYIAGYFGILMAGGVVVGLNTQTTDKSLAYYLKDSGAAVLLTHKKFNRYLQHVLPFLVDLHIVGISGWDGAFSEAESLQYDDLTDFFQKQKPSEIFSPFRSSCDLAQIIYTSGTTGSPKGVMLRHANLVANTDSIVKYLGLSEHDRIMAVLPFFYSYGNSVMLTHIASCGTLVVNQSLMYPNVILQQMQEHRVTGFSGVPSTYALLLNRSAIETFDFSSLRYLTQAGAAMSPVLAGRLKKVFPGVRIFIMYGQTEAAARLAYLDADEVDNHPDSIGKAIPGVTLSLLDKQGRPVAVGEIGEIVARGDNIMAGYWQRPEETAGVLRKEGLWTGDLARQDKEGFFYIVSRKSDIIKSGAHRIGPKEIEDSIAEHPVVHEVAVVGVPDDILDERIRACVVLQDGMECSKKELLKHCRKSLPAYKVPQEIVFLDQLPKTTTGKIVKSNLKDCISSSQGL